MKKIGFVVGPEGAVVKYEPQKVQEAAKPAAPLTRHQRATLYFKALRYASSLLREVGFRTVADCGNAGFSIEMDRFLLEMMVVEPPRMAHVTSYPGYEYDPDKITAKVTMVCPTEGNEYVIRAIGTHNQWSACPVFIVVRPDSQDPLKEAFVSVLKTARDLIARDPKLLAKIQEALSRRDIEREFERLRANDAISESGADSGPRVGRSIEDERGGARGRGYDDAIPI